MGCVLSANRVDLGFFLFHNSNLLPPHLIQSGDSAQCVQITTDLISAIALEKKSSVFRYLGDELLPWF